MEEMRRKDPVKRACWIAGFLVSLMLIWSLALQLKNWSVSEDLKSVQMKLKTLEKDSTQVITNQVRTAEMNKKLAALQQMSTNRLLCASVLNAIQFAIPENMHLVRVRTKQDFEENPMIPMKKDGDRILQAFKPASTTEKIRLYLEGSISGPGPDEKLDLLKRGLRLDAYLKGPFTNETSLRLNSRATAPDLNDPGKTILNFTLEGVFPEITRQ